MSRGKFSSLLDDAEAAFTRALAAARDAASGFDIRAGEFLTDTHASAELNQLDRWYRGVDGNGVKFIGTSWKAKRAAIDENDADASNRLIGSIEAEIPAANAIAGVAQTVTLTRAVSETTRDTLKDIGDAANVTKKLLPWIAGIAVIVVLSALFLRVKGGGT